MHEIGKCNYNDGRKNNYQVKRMMMLMIAFFLKWLANKSSKSFFPAGNTHHKQDLHMPQIAVQGSLIIILRKLQPLYTQRQHLDIAGSWKQPPEVFWKKSVLTNFAKFTGKHLFQGLFFDKVVGWGLQIYYKSDPFLLWIMRNFQDHLFYSEHLRTAGSRKFLFSFEFLIYLIFNQVYIMLIYRLLSLQVYVTNRKL